MSSLEWENLHVPAKIIETCKDQMGLAKPTAVQAACIAPIFQGKHCLAGSPTGTGKTLAFAIPMMGKLFVDPYGVFGLILTPTRELAYQIKDQLELLGGRPVRVSVIVGGVDMQNQAAELQQRPHFVVGTPGRLADHMESNPIMCKNILRRLKFLVFDEADRILDGQFDKQLAPIRDLLPRFIQILLFSATVTENLREITGILMGHNKPFVYDPSAPEPTKTLSQKYILCPPDFKDGYLVELLRSIRDSEYEDAIHSMIIFAPKNNDCEVLKLMLTEMGFPCVVLHSMMPQKARTNSLAQFKSSCVQTLIATDIASRGLDILAVDLVINYSIPMPIDYVHRIGRAGRGCRKGTAISLVTPRDVKYLENIEKYTGHKLTQHQIEELKVLTILKDVSATKRAAILNVEENDVFVQRKNINKRKARILDGEDPSSASSGSELSSTDDEDSEKEKKALPLKHQK